MDTVNLVTLTHFFHYPAILDSCWNGGFVSVDVIGNFVNTLIVMEENKVYS